MALRKFVEPQLSVRRLSPGGHLRLTIGRCRQLSNTSVELDDGTLVLHPQRLDIRQAALDCLHKGRDDAACWAIFPVGQPPLRLDELLVDPFKSL
jgi:hypothetical protein